MKNRLERIEDMIVQRRFVEAENALNAVLNEKIERTLLFRLANLATRINQPFRALELLNQYVYPVGKNVHSADTKEKAEYAAALAQVGAAEEALVLLRSIESASYPLSLLYQALCYFSLWNYSASIPLLTEFVERSDVDLYRHLVGRINLIAALVREGNFKMAGDFIIATQPLVENDFPLLFANLLELTAQRHIFSGQYGEAASVLKKARNVLPDSKHLSAYLLQKWTIVLELYKDRSNTKALKQFREFRKKVESVNRELYRDCDRFESVLLQDQSLFRFLYFGTPFTAYRNRLKKDFGGEVSIPTEYDWNVGGFPIAKVSKAAVFDVTEGKGLGVSLKKGTILHKTALALTLDFYRPMRIASLHYHVFPDEIFNPHSSPKRMYEIIRRLRGFFSERKIPLEILGTDGFFQLKATAPLLLRVEHRIRVEDKNTLYKSLLEEKWPVASFTTQEVVLFLGVSERAAQRLLSELTKERLLNRTGTTRTVKFRFKAVLKEGETEP